jgi:hypothetical protein
VTALKLAAVPVGLWLLVVRVADVDADADRAVRAAVAVGVVLAVAGLVVPPGTDPTYRYTANAVPGDQVHRFLPHTLDCGVLTVERACVLEREVRAKGTVTVRPDARGVDADYRYVRFRGGHAAPNGSVAGGRAQLRLDPVSRERVYEEEFRGLLGVPEPVQRAVLADDGTAVETGETWWEPEHRTVYVNDRYYRVEREPVGTPQSSARLRWAVKLGLVGTGIALLVGAQRLRDR